MIVASPRLVMRPFAVADLRDLAAEADDPRIAENLRDGFPSPYTTRDARRFISSVRDADPFTAMAITRDGRVIGGIGLTPGLDVYRLNGEIGYWIGVAHWGQGIASEAVAAFVAAIWANTSMQRLHADVFSDNPASERVLEKCGFVRESIQRRAVIKNGVIRDLAIWVVLRGGIGQHPRSV